MKTVAVVGGGITGVCTMHYLQRQVHEKKLDVKLVLIEKNEYLGGKIHSQTQDGFIMETGADSIVARHPGVIELVREVDYEDELVYNETGTSFIYTNNELHAIPKDSTFGIPMSLASLEASTLVSAEGKAEALKDLHMPNKSFTKESSIGEFLTYYLGEELVQKQIAPVLSGVYSGNLNELSIASTLPYLIDYKNEFGSIIKGFEANKEQFARAADKKFISFKKGLDSLLYRIVEKLTDVDVKLGTGVEMIKDGRTLQLTNGETLTADATVLALPNDVIAQLLPSEALQPYFKKFTTASVITMYLGFTVPDALLPADGTGYIVSDNTNVVCNAATWTSRKWKHTSAQGNLLVRLFYKNINARYEELQAMTEEELAAVGIADVKSSLGIDAEPSVVNITKWTNQMPRYDLAHREALQGLEQKMAEQYPTIYLAGCSYYGVGIGACIQNGKTIGEKVANEL
ncbi:Protoporphyrinogen oxidase [Metalysinibacillus saudimassiliensis]|uniref:Coproporphyrinogen III oxidase n=1 Tax=Metalysinibacillus saudimassiliensis TaxID=1461583 RepID=A0A078ME31_9BACL|nr:Protoporphyrinogen oxidase [Metalysinibacillus saudimassiliensis]